MANLDHLITEAQVDFAACDTTTALEDAKANGGRVLCGGEVPDGPGYFVPFTIIADATSGMRVVDEEQFGPVLPVIKYDDIDEVVGRANATDYGLGGSVWSSNVDRATEVAGMSSNTWLQLPDNGLDAFLLTSGIKINRTVQSASVSDSESVLTVSFSRGGQFFRSRDGIQEGIH